MRTIIRATLVRWSMIMITRILRAYCARLKKDSEKSKKKTEDSEMRSRKKTATKVPSKAIKEQLLIKLKFSRGNPKKKMRWSESTSMTTRGSKTKTTE